MTLVCWSALKMKVLAIVLLCAFVTVQGRSAVKVIDNSSSEARSEVAQEIQPWLTHLRFATGTSGLLETLVGTLISTNWILTGSGIEDARFVWIRFAVTYVFRPELVYESSAVRSQGPIALVSIREVIISDSIAPINLAQWSGLVSGVSCGFGYSESGGPGEYLQCSKVTLEESEDGKLIGSSNGIFSEYDAGTALVVEYRVQSALLVAASATSVEYIKIDEDLSNYITDQTGVPVLRPPQPDSSESNSNSSESDSNSSESEEEYRVKFVNV